jgi:hypothetical protein
MPTCPLCRRHDHHSCYFIGPCRVLGGYSPSGDLGVCVHQGHPVVCSIAVDRLQRATDSARCTADVLLGILRRMRFLKSMLPVLKLS